MEIAYNFPDLARQYVAWFIQTLPPAINISDVDPEKWFKTRKSLKEGAEKIFLLMVKERFIILPDKEAEKWLIENTSFRFGAVGFILDILYIEADETSKEALPCHLHDLPKEAPITFHAFIASMSHEIFQSLIEANCPDSLIFGEFERNKTFQKKLDEDYSKAIDFFVKKYIAEFL